MERANGNHCQTQKMSPAQETISTRSTRPLRNLATQSQKRPPKTKLQSREEDTTTSKARSRPPQTTRCPPHRSVKSNPLRTSNITTRLILLINHIPDSEILVYVVEPAEIRPVELVFSQGRLFALPQLNDAVSQFFEAEKLVEAENFVLLEVHRV